MRGILAVALGIVAAACPGPSRTRDGPPAGNAAENPQRTSGEDIFLCVIEHGELKTVMATVNAATGDTLVRERPLREVHPATLPPYARDAPWLAREIMVLDGRYYAAHGPPQVIEPELLTRVGEFRGVPVFGEAGLAERGEGGIFVPIRPGCEFQPYVANVDVMPVRAP